MTVPFIQMPPGLWSFLRCFVVQLNDRMHAQHLALRVNAQQMLAGFFVCSVRLLLSLFFTSAYYVPQNGRSSLSFYKSLGDFNFHNRCLR